MLSRKIIIDFSKKYGKIYVDVPKGDLYPMKLWLKKISVFLITLMTLGTYTPPIHLNTEAENEEVVSAKSSVREEISAPTLEVAEDIDKVDVEDSNASIIEAITEEARAHAIIKLGPRIADQVEPDFTATILPNMEQVLHMILVDAGEEEINYYGISELPSKGYGERIFSVHDYRARRDVARFDVRRENRPGEGYWFNFHYHLGKDGFEAHHQIGDIYWDKNTPPKWMA